MTQLKSTALTFIFTALFIAILVSSSCKKADDSAAGPLTGTWVMDTYYMSSGGLGEWIKTDDTGKKFLQFYSSGQFKSNLFPKHQIFTFKEQTFALKSNNEVEFGFSYIIRHDTLTINQYIPVACIEGCGIRFIKQK